MARNNSILVLWKKTSKSGGVYFSGYITAGKRNVRGFYNTNKKNMKEPDLRIYEVDNNGQSMKNPVLSLWCHASKNGKKYLTGKLDDKKVVAFINEKASEDNKQPYLNVYYSVDREEKQENEVPTGRGQGEKKADYNPADDDPSDNLPF